MAGPTTVASGDEIDLTVSLVNQNRTDLQSAELISDYPDGAYADNTSSTVLSHTTEKIGTISAGSSVTKPETLFLFGNKGSTKEVTFTLQYQVTGSNAVFTKVKTYDIIIGSSPVIVDVSAPSTVTSGQQITLTANIISNSSALLHNMLVSLNYPYGFTYQSSSLPLDQNIPGLWNLGDLQSGDKKTLTVTGVLAAQDGEERTFQFNVGPDSGAHPPAIASVMSSAAPTITVSKPLITGDLRINSSDADMVPVTSGQGINADVSFSNSLSAELSNVSIVSTLSGNAFDPATVQVPSSGFYQSSNNTISWDKNFFPCFGGFGSRSVQRCDIFLQYDFFVAERYQSFSHDLGGHYWYAFFGIGGVEQVTTTLSKTARVTANLALKPSTLQSGPLSNTGPVPPKAGQPTTYTIEWSLSNEWNNISGAKVSTTLPAYVDWTGQVSPSTANISYDADTRTIVWNPDSVAAGAGYSLASKQVYFQVKLNASLSQVGNTPLLTGPIATVGQDTFSGAGISFTTQAVSTLTSDTSNPE